MPVHQIALHPRPSGWWYCIAVVPYEPDQLSSCYGLVFARQSDQLGFYKLAAIELSDGSQCGLMRHEDDLFPGTNVLVDEGVILLESLELVRQALDLGKDPYSWINPNIPPEPTGGTQTQENEPI